MDEHDWLAERFEAHRPHLRAVAYRMLGSLREAADAVQEAWLRLSPPSAVASSNWRSSTADEPAYVAARVSFGSSGPIRYCAIGPGPDVAQALRRSSATSARSDSGTRAGT